MPERLRNMTAVYLIKDRNFLLLHREGGTVVNNVYVGTAGGHFEKCELNDPKACVLREMKEETGITEDMLDRLSLRYITMRNVGGEVRQNYYFFAYLKRDMPELRSNEGTLRWVNFDDALSLPMPFSARFVLEHYLKTGRYDDNLYGGVAADNDVVFTNMRM